jgi:hypothetical protein
MNSRAPLPRQAGYNSNDCSTTAPSPPAASITVTKARCQSSFDVTARARRRKLFFNLRKAKRKISAPSHAWRHTIATWLQNKGHSEWEIALILNHSGSDVTAGYSHGYPVELGYCFSRRRDSSSETWPFFGTASCPLQKLSNLAGLQHPRDVPSGPRLRRKMDRPQVTGPIDADQSMVNSKTAEVSRGFPSRFGLLTTRAQWIARVSRARCGGEG